MIHKALKDNMKSTGPEKEGEENLPILRITWMQKSKDLKSVQKRAKKIDNSSQ